MQSLIKNTLAKKPLFYLLIFAFLIRFLLAYFMPLTIQADATFHTLEPAHYLTFGSGFLPAEFSKEMGIRSWVYPSFLAGIMKLCSYITSSPRFYISIINIIMIIFSLLPIYITYKLTYKSNLFAHNKKQLSLLAAALPAFWFTLIIYSPLTLNGTLPAYLFALNCYLIIKYLNTNNNNSTEKAYSLILIGSIFGLITILRFHLLPEIAFALLYCSRKNFIYRAKFLATGFLLSFIPLGFLDWITWSYPFQSIINNIYLNIFKGYAKNCCGTAPVYYYLRRILENWNIFLIPLCYFSYLGFKKYPIFMWSAIINLISFSLIAHKEFRFIFLFIICFFVSAGIGVAEFYESFPKRNGLLKKLSKAKFVYIYANFLFIFIVIAYIKDYKISKNQSLLFSMQLHNVLDKKLNDKTSKVFQFNTHKDAWCGGGYTYLNIDAPYNYQNCWENSDKFLTKNESNLDKPKVIITDKNKFLLGGQKLYCDNKFCAYAYYNQINNTRYYLWKVLPFYI